MDDMLGLGRCNLSEERCQWLKMKGKEKRGDEEMISTNVKIENGSFFREKRIFPLSFAASE